ncbi:MAG: hypothetical protein CM15mP111_0010 [Hyphomicrobiales bacterium]|nr:MAG: hypothetical protein CM15mP111_0010 [Hyphomicrobiales bacterium]
MIRIILVNNTLIVLLLIPLILSFGQDRFSDKKIIKTAQMLEKKGDIELFRSIMIFCPKTPLIDKQYRI